MSMKKKIFLTICFALSLLPMLLSWFGGARGVQEVKGVITLVSPLGILSVVTFLLGMFFPFKNVNANKRLGLFGVVCMLGAELYSFLTWHMLTVTGKFSLQASLDLCYPEFLVGIISSSVMVAVYIYVTKKENMA